MELIHGNDTIRVYRKQILVTLAFLINVTHFPPVIPEAELHNLFYGGIIHHLRDQGLLMYITWDVFTFFGSCLHYFVIWVDPALLIIYRVTISCTMLLWCRLPCAVEFRS